MGAWVRISSQVGAWTLDADYLHYLKVWNKFCSSAGASVLGHKLHGFSSIKAL